MIVDIVVFASRPVYGGVENVTFYLAKNLSNHIEARIHTFNAAQNKNVPYFSPYYSEHLPEKETIEGVTIYRYPFACLPLLGWFSPSLIRSIAKSDSDIVHIEGIQRWFAYLPIAKFCRSKIRVISPHALHEGLQKVDKSPMRAIAEYGVVKSYLNSFNHILVSSETEKQMLISRGCQIDRLTVIPNGIDKAMFDKPTPFIEKTDKKVILSVARFDKYKGQIDLLKALKKIDNEVDFVAYFVGYISDKEYFNELKRLITEMHLENKVKIGTAISDSELADCYLSSNIFVLPSWEESSPISIREAMYASLPVITTNIGSIPELVTDGFNGYLVEPGDIQQMADRLLILLKNDVLCKQIGHRNREFSQQFTWEGIAMNTLRLYETLVSKKQK